MKNYIGMKWKELSETEKENLLSKANAIDGITGCEPKKSGECIIDLTADLSVSGRIEMTDEEDVITVNDDAVIYNPRA